MNERFFSTMENIKFFQVDIFFDNRKSSNRSDFFMERAKV